MSIPSKSTGLLYIFKGDTIKCLVEDNVSVHVFNILLAIRKERREEGDGKGGKERKRQGKEGNKGRKYTVHLSFTKLN